MRESTQYEDEDGRCVRCTVRRVGRWYRGDIFLPFRLQDARLLPLTDARDGWLHAGHMQDSKATRIRDRLAALAAELLTDTVIWQRRDTTEDRMTDSALSSYIATTAAEAPWLLDPDAWEPVYEGGD